MSGRPLRFIGVILTGWVAARAVMLWPTAGPDAIPRALVPAALAEDAAPKGEAAAIPVTVAVATPWQPQPIAGVIYMKATARKQATVVAVAPVAAAPSLGLVAVVTATRPRPQTILAPPPAAIRVVMASPIESRWSASAWFVLRDGRGIAPGLGGGQLGGSQAGLRVAYAIGQARRVAVVGRVATPLKGIGREAALGVEWRPTKLPVRLVAEYRLALDSGTSGPAVGIIAGTGPAPLALGFDLETYGQAGMVRRRRNEPFTEGAVRLSRPVLAIGKAKVDLGLGGWGGVQRGVQRLDVGPSLGVRIPVAGKAIRASLDCGIM